jgi:hypothetical protein
LVTEKPEKETAENLYPILDISDMQSDRDEQMGTKEKSWFWGDPKHWYWELKSDRFLFKAGRPGTGENWAEKIACELCRSLKLPHAEYELSIYRQKKGVITPNFVPNESRLELGNEILARYIKGYEVSRKFKQTNHTLRAALAVVSDKNLLLPLGFNSFKNIDSSMDVFIGYLMLDVWVANQDRHHENWGTIVNEITRKAYLAPTFDHASSLGRNHSDDYREQRLKTRDQFFSMAAYVEKARSAFYNSPNGSLLSTLDAFKFAAGKNINAAKSWIENLNNISSDEVTRIVNKVPDAEMSGSAKEFTLKILELNKTRLLSTRIGE